MTILHNTLINREATSPFGRQKIYRAPMFATSAGVDVGAAGTRDATTSANMEGAEDRTRLLTSGLSTGYLRCQL